MLPPVTLFVHMLARTGSIAVPNVACLAFKFWTIVALNLLVLIEFALEEVSDFAMVTFPNMALVSLML